jgi:hypothetical protein
LTTRSARDVGKPVWTGKFDGEPARDGGGRREASRRPREGRFSVLGIAGDEHTGLRPSIEWDELFWKEVFLGFMGRVSCFRRSAGVWERRRQRNRP